MQWQKWAYKQVSILNDHVLDVVEGNCNTHDHLRLRYYHSTKNVFHYHHLKREVTKSPRFQRDCFEKESGERRPETGKVVL